MVYSDVDNGQQIRPQRLSRESVASFLAKRARGYRKILIPLSGELFGEGVLGPAIDATRSTSAELILLLVHPPAVVKPYIAEQERLFSVLKALQAQMQSHALRVRLDSVTGPAAASVVEYARNNSVDLIVMAGEKGDLELSDDVARVIRSEAECPTFIVREN